MTTLGRIATPARPAGRFTVHRAPFQAVLARLTLPMLAFALLAVVLRLPFLGGPISADEGGFLMVGRQWHPGPSLYGPYWVDRPPVLVAAFQLAAALGGLPALRVLGALAAAVTVLGVGLAAKEVAGRTAATWSSAVACGLMVSPTVGALVIDGELLAAPFIALGVWLSIVAVRDSARARSSTLAALGAGACAALAVLVKQNMLDVAVFAITLGVVAAWHRQLPWTRLRRLAFAFAGGGLGAGVVVLGLAWLRGTAPGDVLFAMYEFRLRAAPLMEHLSLGVRIARLGKLGTFELLSGGVLLLLALGAVVWVRRSRPRSVGLAVALATLVLAAYDVVSILAGGSYWLHYLVQLTVPAALAAGLLAAAVPRPGRALAGMVLVAAAIAWSFGMVHRVPTHGQAVGEAIGRAAAPGDTAVSAFGDAQILEAAGLESPYAYLWSLPARTLDPSFHQLSRVLAGRHAPTWFVERGPNTAATLDQAGPGQILNARYHVVGQVCGRRVYLRDGLTRPALQPAADCSEPLSTWIIDGGNS